MSRSARVGLPLVVGWFSVCMATWSAWDAKVGVKRGRRRRREDMEGRCIVELQLSGFRQRLGALTHVKFGRCRMLNSALISDCLLRKEKARRTTRRLSIVEFLVEAIFKTWGSHWTHYLQTQPEIGTSHWH